MTSPTSERLTWNDLPRWVQVQRNWYRRNKDHLGEPPPEPEWDDSPRGQSMKETYEALGRALQARGPQEPDWYELGGDAAAQQILEAWIGHLRCPECDMPGPGDFGEAWGTVECSDMDCEHVWAPDWWTPWAPPTPKAADPKKYETGPCPLCGKVNRRLSPVDQYAFVCHMPEIPAPPLVVDMAWTQDEWDAWEVDYDAAQEARRLAFESSCWSRYHAGLWEGWYRFLPVWFPFCQGCGAQFAARLEDQHFCSPECGPMPPEYAKRLRKMAASVSPTLRRLEVFERDGWLCHICGKRIARSPKNKLDAASVDHVIPIAAGGTHTMDNVKAAHLRCNLAKGDAVLTDDELLAFREFLSRRGPTRPQG